ILEKEFHLEKSTWVSSLPLALWMSIRLVTQLYTTSPARARQISPAAPALYRPADVEKITLADEARNATASTVLIAPIVFNRGISIKHPMAAPIRSKRYNRVISWEKRVIANVTAHPEKKKGTDVAT